MASAGVTASWVLTAAAMFCTHAAFKFARMRMLDYIYTYTYSYSYTRGVHKSGSYARCSG
jgi:hypothetical protein